MMNAMYLLRLCDDVELNCWNVSLFGAASWRPDKVMNAIYFCPPRPRSLPPASGPDGEQVVSGWREKLRELGRLFWVTKKDTDSATGGLVK